MGNRELKQFAVMAIDTLGGSTKVGELLGIDERVVSNWPERGLPPDTYRGLALELLKERQPATYAVLVPLLLKLDGEAPPVMWRQRMVLHRKVKRPPRPKPASNKPTNGKARRA